MTSLRHASKIVAQNPVILRELSFTMFETYRYLVDKVLKSQKYRSFSDLLNTLFEQHSHFAENLLKKRERADRIKGRKAKKNGKTVTSIERTVSTDSGVLMNLTVGKEEDDKTSQGGDTKRSGDKRSVGDEKKELDIIDEMKNLQEDASMNVRAADQAEEEKDFVRMSSMVTFLCKELNMNRPSDHDRLHDLLVVILVKA